MTLFINNLNQYNGNICFAGEFELYGYFIAECSMSNETLVYASSPQITNIANVSPTSYIFSYNSQYLGSYVANVVNSTYVDCSPKIVSFICNGEKNEYYGYSTDNLLFKFSINPFAIIWEINIGNGISQIKYRESDRTIIASLANGIKIIRDNGNSARVLNDIAVSFDYFVTSDIKTPSTMYISYSQETNIDQSSSSSSSESSFGYSSSSFESSSSS